MDRSRVKHGMTILSPEERVRERVRKTAFTLAEVLITLGIIGVVAALVMPTIQAKYFEKMVVSKLRQSYSILSNAINMMIAEEGCDNTNCYADVAAPDIETIAGRIDKHFKYAAKVCVPVGNRITKAITVDWLPNEMGYDLKGEPMVYAMHNVTLQNGLDNSNICYYKLNNGATVNMSRMNAFGNGTILYIAIDTNGKAGPNRNGKDVFTFTSSTNQYLNSHNRLSPYFVLSISATPGMLGGLCAANHIRKPCKPTETSPAAYVLTYGKLPDLTKVGYPAKP